MKFTAVLALTLCSATISFGQCFTDGISSPCTLSGTIQNDGGIVVQGTALSLTGDTTLNGGGSLTLFIGSVDGAGFTLTNNSNTIQGFGRIGNGSLALVNQTGGLIDSIYAGETLTLNGTGGVINAGTLAASGGVLVLGTGIDNTNGTISADGGTVYFASTVSGGILDECCGVLATQGSATLIDVTLTGQSAYLNGDGATLLLSGTITNGGEIQIAADTLDSSLRLAGDTTLTGGGAVTLSQTGQGGAASLQGDVNGLTLTNEDNLIQGTGVIGGNGVTLLNQYNGTVDASNAGETLTLTGPVTNQGILQASAGTLELQNNTVNNSNGGFISGFGGNVALNGATIQGGSLDGFLETRGSATLDGTGELVGITNGSLYTNGSGATLNVVGEIQNRGDIDFSAGAGNSTLRLTGDTTLSGFGNINLSQDGSGGVASIQAATSGLTLTNESNWISGQGSVGNNGLNILNLTNGILEASGGGVLLVGGNTLSSDGILSAVDGSTLHVTSTLTNFSGGTLSGGQYGAGNYGTTGTLQVDSLGSAGGEIVTNDAVIGLFGATSMFVDSAGNNALSALASNTSNGALGLFDGATLDLQNDFTNEGLVLIDPASTFNILGGRYTQGGEGGSFTVLSGTLNADVDVTGGDFGGDGVVNGNMNVTGGVVSPGFQGNTLRVNGNYTQGLEGELDISIYGDEDYTSLDVAQTASLSGLLDLFFGSGFTPMAGQHFLVVRYTGHSGVFSGVNAAGLDPAFMFSTFYRDNGVEVDIDAAAAATPEPSTWMMITGGFALLAGVRVRQRRRKA